MAKGLVRVVAGRQTREQLIVPDYEMEFWGDCANTFHEEQKQLVYAKRMGLAAQWGGAHPPFFDLAGTSVIDIGGGPVSLLLKCVNRGGCAVVDPGRFPSWVGQRYEECGVMYWNGKGEEMDVEGMAHFDEAWIYNTLQHVNDPAKVIANAQAISDIIRIFEWVDLEPYPGHPHLLTKELLEGWLGAPGFVSQLNENGAVGTSFYGVFSRPTQ